MRLCQYENGTETMGENFHTMPLMDTDIYKTDDNTPPTTKELLQGSILSIETIFPQLLSNLHLLLLKAMPQIKFHSDRCTYKTKDLQLQQFQSQLLEEDIQTLQGFPISGILDTYVLAYFSFLLEKESYRSNPALIQMGKAIHKPLFQTKSQIRLRNQIHNRKQ